MSAVTPTREAGASLPSAELPAPRQPASTLAGQEDAFTNEGAPAPARPATRGPRPETVEEWYFCGEGALLRRP